MVPESICFTKKRIRLRHYWQSNNKRGLRPLLFFQTRSPEGAQRIPGQRIVGCNKRSALHRMKVMCAPILSFPRYAGAGTC